MREKTRKSVETTETSYSDQGELNAKEIMKRILEIPEHLQGYAIVGSLKILRGEMTGDEAIAWAKAQIQAIETDA